MSPTPSTSGPRPIVALDVPDVAAAESLVARLPQADFFKVGLQLFTSAGPDFVRRLKGRGLSVFLDLKFHDIPNTVAGAVRSAAALEVDLLTVHVSGGRSMLRAAVEGGETSGRRPLIFGVSVLTSLRAAELAEAWGKVEARPSEEVPRLARLALECGLDGLVAAVPDVPAIRGSTGTSLAVLTPGIRMAGADPGDQARVATPADAARASVDYVVIGRAVTAAADPAEAFSRVRAELGN